LDKVIKFFCVHWWPHANLVELRHRNLESHLVDDGLKDEVLLFFPRTEEVVLLFAFDFAGAMLGVDDDVIFLKFHPAIVRLGGLKASFGRGKRARTARKHKRHNP